MEFPSAVIEFTTTALRSLNFLIIIDVIVTNSFASKWLFTKARLDFFAIKMDYCN